MVESLWSIPTANDVRAPLTIMKEQATALTEQTKGSLVGWVETTAYGDGDLAISLSIQAPSLNNYKYRLMTYIQPITMYPGRLASGVPKASGANVYVPPQSIKVEDEGEFLAALKRLLSSDEVKHLLSSLLLQANTA